MNNFIKTFPSGLRLAYSKRDFVRSVGITILCGVGSENESVTTNGISHFIEHVLFKGTKMRSPFQIVNEIESIGANINAFTSKQNTCYYTLSIDTEAEKCAEILSDIMFNSTFEEKELQKERKVVLEEISMSEDENDELCFDLMSEAYFGNHPLGRTILGPKENVENFKKEDVLKYMSENYCAEDIVIAICGNIDENRAIDIINKYFEGKFKSIKGRIWKDSLYSTNPNYICKIKDIEQANIAIGMPSIGYSNPNKFALLVANELFGGGMSSRLFQEVREKNGLAYNVYSYGSSFAENGITTVYIGTNVPSVEKAVDLTNKLIKDVIKNGFTKEEVIKGINTVKGRYVIGQESTVSMMRLIAKKALFENEVYSIDDTINEITNLTSDDVYRAFVESYNVEKASIAYIGRKMDTNLVDLFDR